jgi:hypothetical protein
MAVVAELRRFARELPQGAFAARWPNPFLVVGALDDEMMIEFQTRAAPSPLTGREQLPTLTENDPPDECATFDVYPVVKSDRNPFSDRISIGRAKGCDIVLRSGHISKLHAHLLVDPDGGWSLRDAESTNGTFRNGSRLAPGARVAIRSGDTLRFGFLETHFLDAAAMWERLRRPATTF